MKAKLHLFILTCLIAALHSFITHAAIIDINLIPQLQGDCETTITPRLNFSITGQFADTTTPDRDWFSIVLYDGEGTPVGYLSNWVAVGFSAGVNNWTFGSLNLVNQPESRPFTIRVYDIVTIPTDINSATNGALLDVIKFDPAAIGACTHLPLTEGTSSTSIQAPFSDGRLNNWDTGSPIVVFGHDFETGRGLVVYSPEGILLLQVSPEQIAAVADCPTENTLIASASDVSLYRLTTCEFQLNTPSLDGSKTYVLIFNMLYTDTGYTSHEE